MYLNLEIGLEKPVLKPPTEFGPVFSSPGCNNKLLSFPPPAKPKPEQASSFVHFRNRGRKRSHASLSSFLPVPRSLSLLEHWPEEAAGSMSSGRRSSRAARPPRRPRPRDAGPEGGRSGGGGGVARARDRNNGGGARSNSSGIAPRDQAYGDLISWG